MLIRFISPALVSWLEKGLRNGLSRHLAAPGYGMPEQRFAWREGSTNGMLGRGRSVETFTEKLRRMEKRRNPSSLVALFLIVLAFLISNRACAQTSDRTGSPKPSVKTEEADDWDLIWDELGGVEDARVSRAIWTLIASPERTVKLLEKRLRPAAEAEKGEVEAWIIDLDSPKYAIRERAELALRELGEAAAPALREALRKPRSPELKERAERILARAVDRKTTPDRIRSARAIAVLERIGSPDALRLLERIASGSPQARETRLAQASATRLKKRAESSHDSGVAGEGQ